MWGHLFVSASALLAWWSEHRDTVSDSFTAFTIPIVNSAGGLCAERRHEVGETMELHEVQVETARPAGV